MGTHLRATERHLPYGITQCYLPPDTGEWNAPQLNPGQTGWYSIYLPWRDGRLSWPWWLVIYQDGLLVCSHHPSSNHWIAVRLGVELMISYW